MHPVLLEDSWIGVVNSYGTLITLGGMAIGPGLIWDARRRGLPFVYVLDLYIVLILGCFLGGRFIYALVEPARYLEDPSRLISASEGFVFYGAVLGVFCGLAWLSYRYRKPLGEICDILTTWMAFSHAVGRLGCFLVGCCWGAIDTGPGPFAVQFPPGAVVYDSGLMPLVDGLTVPIHPAQLYEIAGLLTLFCVLVWFRLTRGVEPGWTQSARWAIGYGLLRLVTEVFRGDRVRGSLLHIEWPALTTRLGLPPEQPIALSTSQAIGLAMVALGVWYLRTRARPPHRAALP